MMKFFAQFLIACSASAVSMGAFAQQVLGVSPSSRAQIEVFAEPNAAAQARQVAVDSLTFPLDIRSAKSGFSQVDIQGQTGWVRNSNVRVSKGSTAGCSKFNGNLVATISTPGAGKSGCP